VPLSGYLNLSARWCRFRATGLPYMTQSEVGTVSIQLWMYEHLSGSALIKERSSAVNLVHDRVRLQVEVVMWRCITALLAPLTNSVCGVVFARHGRVRASLRQRLLREVYVGSSR